MVNTAGKSPERKSVKSQAKPKKYLWLQDYPEGVDWASPIEGRSLPDMFDEAVERDGGRACTNFLGAELSYDDIGYMADCFAAGLQARGFGKRHRIGLFLPNCPYYVAAYYGILKTGATVVNFNPLYTVEELEHQAQDSGITAMVTLDLARLFDKIAALAKKQVIQTIVTCPFCEILPTMKSMLFRLFKSRELTNRNTLADNTSVVLWNDLLDNDGEPEPVDIKPEEDVALLQYTGGTTGTPKGAMLTHANLTINVEQILSWANTMNLRHERVMGILPFFHVFAMTTVLNFAVRTGSAMILMPKFDLDEAVALIRKTKPTILPGVPTLYTALLNHERLQKQDLSSLKLSICGGAPLPLEVRREFETFSGCKLVEGYGLSETSPVATVNPITGLTKDNSIGQPVANTYISIRSLEGSSKEVPQGERGEICIKGPQVMPGYWNKPEETAATFSGDYFRTGDVGYMDEDGFTYIVDRIKDMINCSGFKVYPRTIEDAIYAHPAVLEVTVVGVPDEYRGEAPKAFIKLKPGATASVDDIFEHLKPKISKIEMPESIEFRDELPKTMVGKLSKKELREEN
jgi:long-chain acyl-CoA synthetase